MVPEFSASMLRLFLHARVAFRVHDTGVTPARARAFVFSELARLSGLSKTRVALAYGGHLSSAASRAALWAALGHFPSDHGVILDDAGGQGHG
jgi:hypothetical protein